ncbi:MAG: MerR family transcriptional regulator [Bacteroidota bacterium]
MTEQITKTYHTIGEVSKMIEIPISVIRYWEKEFDILKPEKTEKGTRKFSQKDIQNLQLIHHLLKEKGFTIQGANDKINNDSDTDKHAEILDSLKRVRDFLAELSKNL